MPALGDEMALRQLFERRGSPKVGIRIDQEHIRGVTSSLSPTAAWFKQVAADLHLNVCIWISQIALPMPAITSLLFI